MPQLVSKVQSPKRPLHELPKESYAGRHHQPPLSWLKLFVSDVARGFPDQAGALQVHTHRAAPAEVKNRADVEVYLRKRCTCAGPSKAQILRLMSPLAQMWQ